MMDSMAPYGAVPNGRQLRWYRRGKVAFLHFSINTFTGNEWGDGTDDPSLFAPSALDCDQWIGTLARAGFAAAILTAKHHDGFCLWPTATTDYSVKSSPYKGGQGDIVREFTDACRRHGLAAGLYLSPWDRHCPDWGTEKYNDIYAAQLTELMGNYGEICECWWDGAGSDKARYDWGRWAKIVRRLQPQCVICGSLGAAPYVDVRWVGNEEGIAGETCFATIDEDSIARTDMPVLNTGKPDGARFAPAECDVSIRPGWFYHAEQDGAVKTPAELVEYWFSSIGRNATILLNVPPDRRGLLHENDCRSLIAWEEAMCRIFATDLTAGASVIGDQAAQALLQPDAEALYVADELCPTVEFVLPQPVRLSCYRLEEAVEYGHRVRGYAVDVWRDNEWRTVGGGGCIGFCRSEHFAPVVTDRVRIRITAAVALPILRSFGLFLVPDGLLDAPAAVSAADGELAVTVVPEEDGVSVELGGIYPYNAVCFDAAGIDRYTVEAFGGTTYETVASGAGGGQAEVTFPTVTGSYRLRVRAVPAKAGRALHPQVYLRGQEDKR